jgi:hypothetical protein
LSFEPHLVLHFQVSKQKRVQKKTEKDFKETWSKTKTKEIQIQIPNTKYQYTYNDIYKQRQSQEKKRTGKKRQDKELS